VLTDEGFIDGFEVIDDGRQGRLDIQLRYGDRGEKVINTIKRESKPGCRVYRSVEDLPLPLGGLGIAIVSTSSGIMSDRRCREENVGGEVVATIA
jgi:small subunit ribosomal protein S8